MANPTNVNWVDPTANVDGSPLAAGEITGYEVGVRASSGTAGTYTSTANVPATVTTCALSALSPALPNGGTFAVAVRALAATDSAWSTEADFTLVPPAPLPPTAVSVV